MNVTFCTAWGYVVLSNGENQKYVFYDYLIFFWKKKIFFFIPPIILVVIAIGISFLGNTTYLGQSTVYTGSVEKEFLLKPDLIEHELNQKLDKKVQYEVKAGDKRIFFSIQSENKNEVKKSLEEVTEIYYKKLNNVYNESLRSKEAQVENVEKQIETFNESINRYKEKLESPSFDIVTDGRYFDLLYEAEKNKLKYISNLNELEEKLYKFEEPRILELDIKPSKSYFESNIIVAFVFGIFLSFIILTFWKYLDDARKLKRVARDE